MRTIELLSTYSILRRSLIVAFNSRNSSCREKRKSCKKNGRPGFEDAIQSLIMSEKKIILETNCFSDQVDSISSSSRTLTV